MKAPDVLILGGGIIGLACAHELAKAGLNVELLERRSAGAEASLAAAGMLAPLSESPEAGPFFEACRASRDLWASWAAALSEETGMSIEHDASGALVVALDPEEEPQLEALAGAARALGEPVEEITPETLAHWVPDIAPSVRRALRLSGDHRVDNVQACAVLAAAAARAGATLTYGFEVTRVERAGSEGERVRALGKSGTREAARLVLAGGAWSGRIPGLPMLPVRPVRGQMALLTGVDWPWGGSVRGVGGSSSYAVRRGATGLLIGSTVEEAGFDVRPTLAGIEGLLAFARRAFPGLAGAHLETVWAGLRPGTPDDLPFLGPLSGWPAVLAATGHFRNGILLAPWTAGEVLRMVLDGGGPDSGSDPRSPFSPARFLLSS
jgi:glycine oxidase